MGGGLEIISDGFDFVDKECGEFYTFGRGHIKGSVRRRTDNGVYGVKEGPWIMSTIGN